MFHSLPSVISPSATYERLRVLGVVAPGWQGAAGHERRARLVREAQGTGTRHCGVTNQVDVAPGRVIADEEEKK